MTTLDELLRDRYGDFARIDASTIPINELARFAETLMDDQYEVVRAEVLRRFPSRDTPAPPPQHHSVFFGEWWSRGVLKPPMIREYPETTAWRAQQVANGARVLTTDEWLALHPELAPLAPKEDQ